MISNRPLRFRFEEDFMEDDVRCIPMQVRFKLDAAGIKLTLTQWSRFSVEERNELFNKTCEGREGITAYRDYLSYLVKARTGEVPTQLRADDHPAWANLLQVDPSLQQKAKEYDWDISIEQWQTLHDLQRFALLKLYRPGHENKNFPKAMLEFGLVEDRMPVEC
jgi:hypothetical protein